MDKAILIAALLLAVIAAVQGANCVHRGVRSRWTVVWLLLSFVAQLAVLSMRSQLRGACPLGDTGEVLLFSAWSLTMCYLLVGSVYRLSLLGVFTAPLVSFLLGVALVPGMMEPNPEHAVSSDVWRGLHAAFSVLAYGALGLSAVAAMMFLVLNQQLKDAHLTTGLFQKLPPARELIFVVRRLLILGFAVLTMGVGCGVLMKTSSEVVNKHLLVAFGVWGCYGLLLLVTWLRGVPPKTLAISVMVLFALSLMVFVLL
ncbi:cytochrome c biogenesis protein CcsA [Verrucomicrobiaceae bacterium N1E253]|uniref:Cytochrome c biogenesis protein CcsA n=1 Tax=Oceaniferula marina TaxID=2748318 RepID=A0A851GJL0_9BACT|nr:cytochrome c biogenesis protein CcsA [Oceaniferula marina]NWK57359.1 cytochrome c biogenesis protein CcsA [Oceaniferula marina]